jgi:thioredoxin-like negative regulator of GroEL
MTGLALCVLLQAAVVGGEAKTYGDALQAAQAGDQPLVVLIGAEWCPGCRVMKHSTLPNLARGGHLSGVQVSVVDTDSDPALAQRLMQGQSIPQLIVFSRGEQGWQRRQFVGPRSEAELQGAIRQAIANQVKGSKVAGRSN